MFQSIDDHVGFTRRSAHRGRVQPGLFVPLGLFLLYVSSVCGGNARTVSADEIVLRGGGQVQGKISQDPKDPDRVQLWLLNGKNPLSFQKQQILRISPKSTPLDEYVIRRGKAASDAPSQFELGQWCEANKLPGLALAHFEASLFQDQGFEPAHQKLGHVLHEGQWLTHDELRTAQGLIKYKGKWITPEEKSQFESNSKTAGEQTSLQRRFRLLRQGLIDGPDDRRRESEAQLMQIREAQAVGPLVRVFGNDISERRKLLILILGRIPGPEAASALVARLLIEPEHDVRHTALVHLKDRKERNIATQLVRALHSSNMATINRAAWAIGHLGIVSAVPRLIPALVSTEERTAWTNPDGALLDANGSTFVPGGMSVPQYYTPPGALLADNGSSFAILTPPAVGPGSVAYGAVAVPYGGYGAIAPGVPALQGVGVPVPTPGVPSVPSMSPNRGPVLRTVLFPVENVEVHDALVALTGRDFGYDIAAWTKWLNREFNPNPDPARKVPQP